VLKNQVVEGMSLTHGGTRFECRVVIGQSLSLVQVVVMSIDAKPTQVRLCSCAKRAEDT